MTVALQSAPAWRVAARRPSLRMRLTAVSVAVLMLCIAGASVLLVWRVHSTLANALDSSLAQRARDVAAEASSGQLAALRSTGSDSATVVQVLGANGKVLASSANIDGEAPMFAVAGVTSSVSLRSGTGNLSGDPGGYRFAAISASSPTGPVSVYAAGSTNQIDQSTRLLVASLLVGAPLLVVLLGVVAWVLVGKALRPVEAMRRQVSAIPGTELHLRLPHDSHGKELQRLASTFNDLLGRIEDGAAHQRRFLADAAHELRNPVASLRARLDIRANNPRVPTTSGDLARLAADTARLASLVDSLLSLARLDAHTPLRREPVDLDDLVLDHVRRVAGLAHPHVDAEQVSAAQVIGDRAALDRMVANLVDNAVRHATDLVHIELRDDTTAAVLTVVDDGVGILASDRERVFERFTRLDDARGRDEGGAGLGLAIVRDIVHAHGGRVWIEANGPGARFVVALPHAERA
jgi:signal transduction histidine kinase